MHDGFVKSRKCSLSVIPAKAGIQCFQALMKLLDPVFQRGDDSFEAIMRKFWLKMQIFVKRLNNLILTL